jgi:hypothetical protein
MKYILALCMAVMAVLACTQKKSDLLPQSSPPPSAVADAKPLKEKPKGIEGPGDTEARVDIELLVQHYRKHSPQQDEGLARFAAVETARFAALLGMNNEQLRDMLALWWVESTYRQNSKGEDGKSWGITQVRIKRIKELTKAWEDYGYDEIMGLGTIYDPTRQIAMGVMAYSIALREAKGDRFQALRRYNGGNKGKKSKAYKQAHAHAMRVVKARKAIFGE